MPNKWKTQSVLPFRPPQGDVFTLAVPTEPLPLPVRVLMGYFSVLATSVPVKDPWEGVGEATTTLEAPKQSSSENNQPLEVHQDPLPPSGGDVVPLYKFW